MYASVVVSWLSSLWNNIRGYGLIGYPRLVVHRLSKRTMQWVLTLPPFKSKVDAEVGEVVVKIEQ